MLPMIFGNRARCTARQQVSFLATHVGEGEVPISAAEKGDQHVGEGEGEGVGGDGGGGEGGGGEVGGGEGGGGEGGGGEGGGGEGGGEGGGGEVGGEGGEK